MDLWVVAAAAGAGYIAKNWQNSSIGDKESSDEVFLRNSIQGQSNSSNFLDQIREKTCPVSLLARRRRKREAFLQQVADVLDRNGGTDLSETMASSSHSNFSKNVGMDEYGVHWSPDERFQATMESVDVDCGICPEDVGVDEYNVHWSERGNVSGSKEFVEVDRGSTAFRFKKSTRLRNERRHEYFIRPLDSSERCVVAQICREHEGVEEYVYTSTLSKPTSVLRPLLVTDGSRIISRASIDSSVVRYNGEIGKPNDPFLEENKAHRRALIAYQNNDDVYGLHRKSKTLPRGEQTRRSNNKVNKGPFDSAGSSNELIMFFMGMTIGILSVFMTNRRELDKLSIQLKQSENLLEDLHEELEMKNKTSVRELVDEASQPPQTMDDFCHFHPESNKISPQRNDEMMESHDLKNDIEAELFAELERLELDLKTSSLEMIGGYATLNEDVQASMVEGDILNVQTGGESESDNEESAVGNNYYETGNYAVSPRELTLRLHEVIEARLEARIKELETTIQNSERRLHFHESQRRFTYIDLECSSTPQSPVYTGHGSDEEDPLVINLAGNALEAYNEAYAEMLRMTGSEHEPDSPLYHKKAFESTSSARVPEDFSGTSPLIKIRSYEDLTSRSLRSSERDDGEEEDDDHELDMLLIRRIVEKKRSGANLLVYGS